MALKVTRLTVLPFSAFFQIQRFEHVPGNGLALAIGVGGEDQIVGVLHGVGDGFDVLRGLGVDFPVHGEIVIGLYGAVLGGQVADVAVARPGPCSPSPNTC